MFAFHVVAPVPLGSWRRSSLGPDRLRRDNSTRWGHLRLRRSQNVNALLRIAVLISGGGRSLKNLLQRIESGELTSVEVGSVVASKTSAAGLQYAEERGIPRSVLRPKDFSHVEEFSAAISEEMDRHAIDLVVLAGWMHFYQIPSRYEGRVLNIHPSLIPAFCGQGYYGTKVHQAVLDFGAKITGCTVHFADNQFDHGPVILQRSVPVLDDDTVESLAARVFEEEKLALPEAIQMIADDRIEVRGRRVRVRGGA